MDIKLSKVSFFLFVFFYNYLWLRLIIFPYMYDMYGSMSFWYCFIIMGVCLILLLIPNKIYRYDYSKSYIKSRFKYIYNFILVLEIILGIVIGSGYLSRFVNDINTLLLIIGISVVISVISNMKGSSLINMATIFNIVCLILVMLSFIYFIPIDVTILLPVEFNKYSVLLIGIFLICDNLSFLLLDKESFCLNKIRLVAPIVLSVIFFCFEIFMLITSSGDSFFKGKDYVGIMVMMIKPVAKYVGNFEFVYIVCLILVLVFKFGFNLSIVKNSVDTSNRYIKNIPCYLIILGAILAHYFIDSSISKSLIVGSNYLKIICLTWVFMEGYHVWKTKRK